MVWMSGFRYELGLGFDVQRGMFLCSESGDTYVVGNRGCCQGVPEIRNECLKRKVEVGDKARSRSKWDCHATCHPDLQGANGIS